MSESEGGGAGASEWDMPGEPALAPNFLRGLAVLGCVALLGFAGGLGAMWVMLSG